VQPQGAVFDPQLKISSDRQRTHGTPSVYSRTSELALLSGSASLSITARSHSRLASSRRPKNLVTTVAAGPSRQLARQGRLDGYLLKVDGSADATSNISIGIRSSANYQLG